MDPRKTFEAVDTLVQGMEPSERVELAEKLSQTFPEAFGVQLAVAGAEVPADQTETVSLTAEQQEKADAAKAAMAEKFGVAEEDFSILRTTDEDDKDTFTVAYTAKNGVDLGDPKQDYDKKRSWNDIFDGRTDKKFMVEIDGQKVDTRTGMTKAAYEAFIADAKARGEDPLPNSLQLAEQNNEVWTDTWLTGEEVNGILARIACVSGDGRVRHGWDFRDRARRALRFRPAVVIE